MKSEQAAFGKRLRAALQARDIEPSPKLLIGLLARNGGIPVTSQAISGWLQGKYLPKQANLRALATILDVDAYELQYGGKKPGGVGEARATWPAGIAGIDRLAIEEFLRLPAKQRALVREMIGQLTSSPRERKA